MGPQGIRLHAVSPGPLARRAASCIGDFDEPVRRVTNRVPERRVVTIEAVGATCALLASRYAAAMTGETLDVDGGFRSLGQRAKRPGCFLIGLACRVMVDGVGGEDRVVADTPVTIRHGVMPTEPTQARRFGKARTAQSGALLEDYVELISDLLASEGEARPTDIARRLGVSHATAIKTIGRLKREGLAVAKPYRGVFLTEPGESLAERVRARHRLVVDVLVALGVPAEAAEQDAEGIEHHVSDATLTAFGRFLRRRERG